MRLSLRLAKSYLTAWMLIRLLQKLAAQLRTLLTWTSTLAFHSESDSLSLPAKSFPLLQRRLQQGAHRHRRHWPMLAINEPRLPTKKTYFPLSMCTPTQSLLKAHYLHIKLQFTGQFSAIITFARLILTTKKLTTTYDDIEYTSCK